MEELAKIVRVIRKKDPDAPHNTLLVLDATTGQNALSQVKTFQEMADVSGLVMTKLDGPTAKAAFGLPMPSGGRRLPLRPRNSPRPAASTPEPAATKRTMPCTTRVASRSRGRDRRSADWQLIFVYRGLHCPICKGRSWKASWRSSRPASRWS
jgi:hypothetical protein